MIKTDFQKIADSFSVGVVSSAKPIKEPFRVESIRKNPLTGQDEIITGWLSLFHLQTSNGFYVLIGITPNTLTQKDIEISLQKELNLTYFEYLSDYKNIPIIHKVDLYWYLLQPFQMLDQQVVVKKISKLTKNQEINIQIGYGGVLFVGIGKSLEPEITRASGEPYREMEFFVGEWWEIWDKDKKVASRFEGELADEWVTKINGQKITDFTIQPSCKKTFINIGDYSLVIYRTEEFITWDFTHRIEDFLITLTGRKKFQIKDDVFERPGQTTKKHHSFKPTVFDQFYKEDLPISHNNVQKLIKPMLGSVVKEVRENTGIAFCLPLRGDDDWLLCINTDWELYNKSKSILSSRSHKFVYATQLDKYLINKKLTSLVFSENLDETIFTFGKDLKLVVKIEKKCQLWTIFNHNKGFHFDALNDGTFKHIIICPHDLEEKYLKSSHGSAFANNLYALDFYRDIISIV